MLTLPKMKVRKDNKVSLQTPPISFAIRLSFLGLVLIVNTCCAGTIPNRQNNVITPGSNPVKKSNTGQIMHPAFQNAGRTKGLEIWRIENFEPVPYPKQNYGKFYTGDSYIVLNTKEGKNKELSWDVHFWLGSQTSQDEAGAAAILTVQLDDLLNDAPIQHREVQDHESALFFSYFQNGVRYESGGVKSGFKHVDINAPGAKRLFKVKGKKKVRVAQVPLSINSMNKGDCFILDAGNDIYIYVGEKSKIFEKLKASSAANQIRDEDKNGRGRVHIIDSASTDADRQKFFQVLGSGSPETVPDESPNDTDEDFEINHQASVKLYTVSDESGSLKVEPITQKPLRQEMLNSRDCFILDTGSELFVWVGQSASKQEKSQAMAKAEQFLVTKNLPRGTQIHRLIQGGETAPFKQYFATWKDAGMKHSRLIRAANYDDTDGDDKEEFNPSIFRSLKKSGGSAFGFMPDNGEGELENIWRVKSFDLHKVDPQEYGIFYEGDSYVIKYRYPNQNGGQQYIIYFWQGKESSIDEKAASAIHAARLDKELGGNAIQVRVLHGHEPRHFLKIFKGKLIFLFGGFSTGFKNKKTTLPIRENTVRLLRIRGTCKEDVHADERSVKAKSLASDDVFLLETENKAYIWKGEGASYFEKNMALKVASRLLHGKTVIEIDEGEETNEFWAALGGQEKYNREVDPLEPQFLEPRLFHCMILANGNLRVEELGQFEQKDLAIDDIMLLDSGDELYVWIGEKSTLEERETSLDMAQKYLKFDPVRGEDKSASIIKVNQGHEPKSFKSLFPSWDDNYWQSMMSFEDVKNAIKKSNDQ